MIKIFIASYIHVCGNNPNYHQCFLDNINNVKKNICSGILEFNIHPIEPLIIDKIVVYDTDNLKISLQDSKVTRFCDFVVTSFYTISPEKDYFEFNLTLKNLGMDSIFDSDTRLLVHLAYKDLVHVFSGTQNLILY